ncbi:hypothetical protein Bca101_098632 [Brassica carinata]
MFLYIIGLQGLDPRTTTKLFSKVQFCGEKRIEDNDDSVLKISADRDSLIEQNDAGAPTESYADLARRQNCFLGDND